MRYVLFTGATGGLGGLCVRELARRGFAVFAAGTNGEKLAELGALPNVTPLRMDVTSDESVRKARDWVAARTDRLYAVVNFAGASGFASMVEGDPTAFTQRLLEINVLGAVRVNRAFFGLVEQGGGRIVNCSSEAGWMKAQPFAAAYYLSKRALEAYNDSLRRELMFLGIPVVKLQPGSYATHMTDTVTAGFDKTLAQTRRYRDVLTKMRPMMDMELKQNNDPARVALALVQALEAKKPRLQYRVGTGRALLLLELLPERWMDGLYKLMLKTGLPGKK